ncbi:hypothetical protein CF326_g5859 [Tilletia indica]|nr:hypothetical protein CF326_g5859 [Tilletia indica]
MTSHQSITPLEEEEPSTFNLQRAQNQVQEPTTPQTVDIVHEIRSANAQLSARLDGFNLRLGDMERYQRLQSSQPDSPSPPARALPSARTTTTEAAPSRPLATVGTPNQTLPASVTLQRGPHRARTDAAVPPHMARTAAALASTSLNPPSRPASNSNSLGGQNPLDRYRSMTKGEKTNVKRALASLGLTVPTLMDMFKSGEDDSVASTLGEDEQPQTSASPTSQTSGTSVTAFDTSALQTSSNIVGTTTPVVTVKDASSEVVPGSSSASPPSVPPQQTIDPAPNIAATSSSPAAAPISTRTMTCKTEWIGDYDGDPTQLEDFLTRLRDLIRSETQKELIPSWITAVLRTLPRTLKGNAAIWHQGLSDSDAAKLTSLDAWCAAMRSAFPVNRQQLKCIGLDQ